MVSSLLTPQKNSNKQSNTSKRRDPDLDRVNLNVAGIDIGATGALCSRF